MFQPLLEPKEGKQPRLFLLSFVSLVSLAPLYLIMYTDSTQNEDCQCARFEEIWASCSDAHERIGIGLNSVFPLPTSRICVFSSTAVEIPCPPPCSELPEWWSHE